MLRNLYILMILLVSSECAFQNSRYKNSFRQSNGATSQRVRPRNTCSPPRLVNGIVTPLFKGKLMRFDCTKGYSRLGERYSECLSGRWSIYTFPICIKAGCPIITAPDNGKVTYLNAKASVMLFCEPNYETVGNSFAHCNGSHWDRNIGNCRETTVNTAPTSCDFESESICGWIQDTDHDFDFERRTGYNNKTILMVTGPHADHTTGVPFQGHFLVINTNMEPYTKRARLISPLFKISAKALCFKFFYHMYGVNLGTLRVYMKPESVDMQKLLLEDTESEARNDYIVFEMKGSQGNSWHEGGGYMKPVNESFQIIIEAISGQTRLSDIAFDDISILSDDQCLEAEEEEKTQETSEDADNVGVFTVDSCLNRCFEEKNTTVQLSLNNSLSCSCSKSCDPKTTCCPDFIDICLKFETIAETSSTTMKTNIKFSTMTSTKSLTTMMTVKVDKIAPESNLKDYADVGIIVEGEDEHDVEQDETTTYDSDNIVKERFTMKSKSLGVDVSLIIKASVIAISAIILTFFMLIIVYKQYKKSTNPLNYKEKQENVSRKDEEFSEIRFLTSDETLDFNLLSTENAK